MHLRFDETGTTEEVMFRKLNILAEKYGFTSLSAEKEPIYNTESGTLNKQTYMYVMLYVLQLYQDVEQYAIKCAEELHELYKMNNESEFVRRCSDITKRLNQGKMTKKQKAKSVSIWNSLKLLENLDEDYNAYIINKYMASGDSGKMETGGCLKF